MLGDGVTMGTMTNNIFVYLLVYLFQGPITPYIVFRDLIFFFLVAIVYNLNFNTAVCDNFVHDGVYYPKRFPSSVKVYSFARIFSAMVSSLSSSSI